MSGNRHFTHHGQVFDSGASEPHTVKLVANDGAAWASSEGDYFDASGWPMAGARTLDVASIRSLTEETDAMPESRVPKSPPRIKWSTVPNDNIRMMECDVELWDSIKSDVYERPITEEQQRLVKLLDGIRGVVELGFKKFTIRITKGGCFAWDEIAPRVEQVFAEWCGVDDLNRLPSGPINEAAPSEACIDVADIDEAV